MLLKLLLTGIAPINALHSALKYLQYSNIFTRAFSIVQWWIIEAVYGIANATSEFLNKMLNVGSFVNQVNGSGEIGNLMRMGQKIAPMLMIICLMWIAIKIIIDHHPPRVKNVLVQLFISAFLITNIGPVTSFLSTTSVQMAQGLMGTTSKVSKGTSALPFDVMKDHTNDLEYMIDTNFKGTRVSSSYSTDTKPAKLHWGLNDLSRSKVDHGEVDFTEVLDYGKIKDGSALEKKDHPYKKGDYDKTPGTHFLYGWLKYTPNNTPKKNGKGSTWIANDIWHLFDFSMGGYLRYTVNFLPVLICLLALAFAYIFAGYAIVKSFIDIVVMEILSTIIFATDLDTGQKTKKVVTSIFSAVLLVSLQAFELAFYQAASAWANKGITSAWGFTIFILAATIMLVTGNEKVSQFFNVDTGAQHGWRAAGSAMYGAKQLGRLGMATMTAPIRAKNAANNIGDKFNSSGSIRRAATKQAKSGSRQNAINKMAGFDLSGNVIKQPTGNNGQPTDGLPPIGQLSSARAKTSKIQKKAYNVGQEDKAGAQNVPFSAPEDTADNAQPQAEDVPKEQAPQQKTTNPDDLSANSTKNSSSTFGSTGTGTGSSGVKANPGSSVNRQSHAIPTTYPISKANYNSWKNRAKQYDSQNHLTSTNGKVGRYSPVDFNPVTSAPYTYNEWKDNVNDVRTNDVPNQNLDGTDFIALDNTNNVKRPTDTPTSKYVKNNLHRQKTDDRRPTDDSGSTIPPKFRK